MPATARKNETDEGVSVKAKALTTTANASENVSKEAKESTAICNKAIATAHASLKTAKQSRDELEKALAYAVNACFLHARSFGDVMPMDRLVKPLFSGDRYEQMLGNEIVAWLRANSPVRWDAKRNPFQAKPDEPGYKEYIEDPANVDSFYESAQAKASRAAGLRAANRALNPISLEDMRTRVYGIKKWVLSAGQPNKNGQKRGYETGQKSKMLLVANGIIADFDRMIGEQGEETKAKIEEKLAEAS